MRMAPGSLWQRWLSGKSRCAPRAFSCPIRLPRHLQFPRRGPVDAERDGDGRQHPIEVRISLGFRFRMQLAILRLTGTARAPPHSRVRNPVRVRSHRGSRPCKLVALLRLPGPNFALFVRLIIGWSQVQVLVDPPNSSSLPALKSWRLPLPVACSDIPHPNFRGGTSISGGLAETPVEGVHDG